jgi:hypothetical protein
MSIHTSRYFSKLLWSSYMSLYKNLNHFCLHVPGLLVAILGTYERCSLKRMGKFEIKTVTQNDCCQFLLPAYRMNSTGQQATIIMKPTVPVSVYLASDCVFRAVCRSVLSFTLETCPCWYSLVTDQDRGKQHIYKQEVNIQLQNTDWLEITLLWRRLT